MSRRLAVGVGCRRGVPAEAVETAVRAALAGSHEPPIGLFTLDDKRGEPGLVEAAGHLGLTLSGLEPAALRAVEGRLLTRSAAALARFGLPAVAEAAALAALGERSRLVAPRLARDGVTVAVAEETEE